MKDHSWGISAGKMGYVKSIKNGKISYGDLTRAKRFKSEEELRIYAKGFLGEEIYAVLIAKR